jgi:hypothetical protein
MKLHYLLLAIALTILSSTGWAASNEEAILGRWYYSGPNLYDEGLALDISEDQIVFGDRITYQTTIVGNLGESLLFKIIGVDLKAGDELKITAEDTTITAEDFNTTVADYILASYGCGARMVTYIIAEPLASPGKFMSPGLLLSFYGGSQEPTSVYNDICVGKSFIRKSVVNSAY